MVENESVSSTECVHLWGVHLFEYQFSGKNAQRVRVPIRDWQIDYIMTSV